MNRLKKADRPTVLTQNGRTAAVVLSKELYERLVSDAELGRSIDGLRQSLEDPRPSIPLSDVAAHLRAKYVRSSNSNRRRPAPPRR